MTLQARWLVVAATLVAHVPPLVFGALTPGYSHVRHYISELGAVGMPYGAIVSLGTFLPAGLLVVFTCLALASRLPATGAARLGLGLVSLIGVSWVVAAFAPCDAGCPAEGSARQAVHNLAGAIGYIGGGTGLVVLGLVLRSAGAPPSRVVLTTACGLGVVAGLLAMASPELSPVRGAIQRGIEWSVFGWLFAAAWSRVPGPAAP